MFLFKWVAYNALAQKSFMSLYLQFKVLFPEIKMWSNKEVINNHWWVWTWWYISVISNTEREAGESAQVLGQPGVQWDLSHCVTQWDSAWKKRKHYTFLKYVCPKFDFLAHAACIFSIILHPWGFFLNTQIEIIIFRYVALAALELDM